MEVGKKTETSAFLTSELDSNFCNLSVENRETPTSTINGLSDWNYENSNMGSANRDISNGNAVGCSVSETLEAIWEEFQSNGSESLPTSSNSISSAFRKPPVSYQNQTANHVLPNSTVLSMELLNSILKTFGIENPSEQDKALLHRMLIRMKQQSLIQNIMQNKMNAAGGNNILNNFNMSNLSQSNVIDQQSLQEMMYYQQLLASANPDLFNLNSPAAKFAMINSQLLQGQFRRRRVPSVVGGCAFCRNNGEQPSVFKSHVLRDSTNKVRCPVLRAYTCPNCSATGDSAHTIKYCPHLLQDTN